MSNAKNKVVMKKVVRRSKGSPPTPTKSNRKVVVKLEFNAGQLNELLNYANFTESPSRRVEDLTNAEFAQFRAEIQGCAGNFVEEIIDTARDACANDWLYGWGPEDEDNG